MINLSVPLQQALNQLAIPIKRRDVLIYRNPLPSLDINQRIVLDLFKSVLSLIVLSTDIRKGSTIRIESFRLLESGGWIISFLTDVDFFPYVQDHVDTIKNLSEKINVTIDLKRGDKVSEINLSFPFQKK